MYSDGRRDCTASCAPRHRRSVLAGQSLLVGGLSGETTSGARRDSRCLWVQFYGTCPAAGAICHD